MKSAEPRIRRQKRSKRNRRKVLATALAWCAATSSSVVAAQEPTLCEPLVSSAPTRELTLSIGGAFGAFFAETPGWVRSDLSVRLELGVRVHPQVVVQLGLLNSTERLAPTIRAATLWFPFERWLYGKLGLDITMAGAGVQPGLSGAIGVAWWSPVPLGLFVELEAAGRLTEPMSVELTGAGGLFAYF